MELLYLYIENDGKNINDCEFNFSPEYYFHYDKQKEYLEYEENKSYIPNFWGCENISNITAIIGKNGAGKSSLLKRIISLYSHNKLDNVGRIIVSKESDKIIVYSNNIALNQPQILSIDKYIQPQMIYVNPSVYNYLNGRKYPKMAKLIDVSICNLMVEDAKKHSINGNTSDPDVIYKYHQIENTIRNIQFLKNTNTFNCIEWFQLPQKFYIECNTLLPFSELRKIGKYEEDFKKINEIYEHNINNEAKTREDKFKTVVYESLVSELMSFCIDFGIKYDLSIKGTHYRTFCYSFYNQISHRNFSQNEKLIQLFQEVDKSILSTHFDVDPHNLLNAYVSFDDIQQLFISYSKLNSFFESAIDSKYEGWDRKSSEAVYEQCIKIRWEYLMSSGEELLLNLLSNLFFAYRKINIKEDDTIIILLDEAETSFHPEWQRRYLQILTKGISEIFKGFKVQVILASHSPIIISDFPKENIIFLDKNQDGTCKVVDSIGQKNTFGANIHTLYKNGFFLDGLPIGEFAKQKINNMFDSLRRGEATQSLYNQIQMVGEPLLKSQLLKLYNQNYPYNIEERISNLEEELAQLKQKREDD